MPTATAPPPTGTRACPKCGHANPTELSECARCHVLIDKALRAEAEARDSRKRESDGWFGVLGEASELSIKQQVERLEAWTGIETANSYFIADGYGSCVAHAVEEQGAVGSFLVRNFLKSARPFTMRIEDTSGETVLVFKRPFHPFYSELEVLDPFGKRIGHVRQRLSLVNRIYRLVGRRASESYEIHGPFFRPWTFKILRNGRECGRIEKCWSGLRREMYTDADSFGIEFPSRISPALKSVFLGAVFLIDFAHFEDNNGKNRMPI
jgi:uncharacterized protein YxjI